jgi:hypothetical protein
MANLSKREGAMNEGKSLSKAQINSRKPSAADFIIEISPGLCSPVGNEEFEALDALVFYLLCHLETAEYRQLTR